MEDFKCPACKNEYNDTNPPRLLTICGHTFCQNCLRGFMTKKRDGKYRIRCPEDKIKADIDTSDLNQFPKNIVLVQAIKKKRKGRRITQTEESFENEFIPKQIELALSQKTIACQQNQNLCLLHYKPLEIVCIIDKIIICAQCALFGMHKGHKFVSLKEINIQKADLLKIAQNTIDKKQLVEKNLQSKEKKNLIEENFKKNKEKKIAQLKQKFQQIRIKLDKHEKELLYSIQQKLQTEHAKLFQQTKLSSDVDLKYCKWQQNFMREMPNLEDEELIRNVELLIEGERRVKIKDEAMALLQLLDKQQRQGSILVESPFHYPKISLNQKNGEIIKDLVQIQTEEHTKNKPSIRELEIDSSSSIPITTCKNLEDISLLDLSGQKYFQTTQNSRYTMYLADESMEFKDISLILPNDKKTSKVLHNTTIHNKPMMTSMMAVSPKANLRNRTNSNARNGMLSPNMFKSKLRKVIMKVKDPDRFEKMLYYLDNDGAEVVDFAGLEMGDEAIKQIASKLKNTERVKNMKLSKNLLSDECSQQILESLLLLDSLNLTYNNFSQKILDKLIKNHRIFKDPKSIFLGQNRINARKAKQKIEQLRHYGINITL